MKATDAQHTTVSEHTHAVHFYSHSAVMEAHVASYLKAGIRAGETVIVLATRERREGFAKHLRLAFPEVEGQIDTLPNYTALDADEVLSTFLVQAWPEQAEFFETMDRIFMKPVRTGKPIRVYGEMVVRLWQAGSPEAAFNLEEFWNLLTRRYSFSLLCAYPLNLFEDDNQRFLDTCARHNQLSVVSSEHVCPV